MTDKKKQTLNKFLIKDVEVLNLDINKFKTHNGNKEEIPSIDIKESYNLAKKRLDLQVNKEIKAIKGLLNIKLNKELDRIKDYYFKQIKEKDDEVERCKEKIKLLESKLKHTYYERDINTLKRMIRESKARLEMLQKRSYKERLHNENVYLLKRIKRNKILVETIRKK